MNAIHFRERTKVALIWGGILLTIGFLYMVGPIVAPFIWALVTVYILDAGVRFLQKRAGGPRTLWALLIYFGLVIGLTWLIFSVGPVFVAQIRQLIDEFPQLTKQFEGFFGNIKIGETQLSSEQVNKFVRESLDEFVAGLGERAPELVRDTFETLLMLLVYLVATFSLLLNLPRIIDGVRGLFSKPVVDELDPWFTRIDHTLLSYLRGQLLLVVIVSVATYVGLSAFGVRFALALAIMSGLVETIPYLGPYVAGGIAVLVATTQTQSNNFGWPPLVLGAAVAILYTIIRQTEDYLVMPFVIGHTVELHPLSVLFVVLAGASVAGIMGLLLAVPVAATLKIIVEFLWQKIQEPATAEPVTLIPPGAPTAAEGAPAGAGSGGAAPVQLPGAVVDLRPIREDGGGPEQI